MHCAATLRKGLLTFLGLGAIAFFTVFFTVLGLAAVLGFLATLDFMAFLGAAAFFAGAGAAVFASAGTAGLAAAACDTCPIITVSMTGPAQLPSVEQSHWRRFLGTPSFIRP